MISKTPMCKPGYAAELQAQRDREHAASVKRAHANLERDRAAERDRARLDRSAVSAPVATGETCGRLCRCFQGGTCKPVPPKARCLKHESSYMKGYYSVTDTRRGLLGEGGRALALKVCACAGGVHIADAEDPRNGARVDALLPSDIVG